MRFGLGLALGRRHAASAGDGAQKSMTLTVEEDITETSGLNYAPHSVTVICNPAGFPANSNSYNKYDALVGEIQYLIDWGDPGTVFTVPQKLPNGFESRNVSIGRKSTHVYRASGNYTITVYAYDYLGNWAVQTASVTVKADDFTSANTIVMDTTGNFTGAPSADAANQVQTWAAMWSRLQALEGSQSIVKIYAKYGDSYSSTTGFFVNTGVTPHIVMDAWGTPGDGLPVFNFPVAGASKLFAVYGPKLLKVANCRFTNGWDTTSELYNSTTVASGAGHVLYLDTTTNEHDILFDNVEVDGFGLCFYGVSGTNGRVTLHEVDVHNNKDYFWHEGNTGQTISIVGTSLTQPANRLNCAEDRWGMGDNRSAHTGNRTQAAATLIMTNNHWVSEHGWNPTNLQWDQSLTRFNANGGTTDLDFYVNRNTLEGSLANGSFSEIMECSPIYYESNHIIVTNAQGGYAITTDATGMIARNNIFTIPQTTNANCGSNPNSIVQFFSSKMDAAAKAAAPIICEGNTFVDLRLTSQRNASFVGVFNTTTQTDITMTLVNNVYYAPNLDTPDTSAGPLASTSMGYTGSYQGVRHGYDKWSGTISGGDVVNGGTLTVAYGTDFSGNAVTQSSYSGEAGRHGIKIGTADLTTDMVGAYLQVDSEISVSFGASDITITNNSGVTWTNGQSYVVHFDRGTAAMPIDTAYASTGWTAPTYAITSSSGAYETATGNVSPLDFFGAARRGSNHPNATAGTPSPGALEEVTAQTGSALLETGDVVLLETADAMLLG